MPRLTDLSGSYVEFDPQGFLSVEVDRHGNRTHYEYAAGALETIDDDYGRFLAFTYNGNGFVESVTDHSARQWSYTYNSDATLASVTNPLGGTYSYEYELYTPVESQFPAILFPEIKSNDLENKRLDYHFPILRFSWPAKLIS